MLHNILKTLKMQHKKHRLLVKIMHISIIMCVIVIVIFTVVLYFRREPPGNVVHLKGKNKRIKNVFSKYLTTYNKNHAHRRFCPCCGWVGNVFNPINGVLDRVCPICGARERHRKTCFTLANNTLTTTKLTHSFRLVHFGPHITMEDKINQMTNVDQVSVDYFYPGYKYSDLVLHADVVNLNFPTNFAQGIIILHVLEHISKLDSAFSELKRVLHPQGWIIIEVPCRKNAETKDCRGLMTEAERFECTGQRDHVWIFGCQDWAYRLNEHYHCSQVQFPTQQIKNAILPKSGGYLAPGQFICRQK